MPRTSWGDPDLQGIWTNATLTPVERPEALAATEVLSTEEAAALEVQTAETRRENDRLIPGVVGAYNQFWMDAGTTVVESRRTSLVVDPPDGRIPWSEAGRARLESDMSRYGVGPYDSWVDADTGERCLTDGLPLVPLQGYNMNTHILQAPGWVAILNEMFHEYRIVPLDGRRGHRPGHRPVAGRRGRPLGGRHPGRREHAASPTVGHYLWRWTWRAPRPALHLVERFTRVDEENIAYEFTMTDPEMFTRPWTAQVPMTTDHASRGVTSGPMYEYACHEGNYGLLNMLRGARAEEQQ